MAKTQEETFLSASQVELIGEQSGFQIWTQEGTIKGGVERGAKAGESGQEKEKSRWMSAWMSAWMKQRGVVPNIYALWCAVVVWSVRRPVTSWGTHGGHGSVVPELLQWVQLRCTTATHCKRTRRAGADPLVNDELTNLPYRQFVIARFCIQEPALVGRISENVLLSIHIHLGPSRRWKKLCRLASPPSCSDNCTKLWGCPICRSNLLVAFLCGATRRSGR